MNVNFSSVTMIILYTINQLFYSIFKATNLNIKLTKHMIKKRASLEENLKTKRAINNDNLEAF